MNNRKFDKNISYCGKWILYRKYSAEDYTSIYVKAISNGIVKYVFEYDQTRNNYVDVKTFEYCETFMVNPIQMSAPDDCQNDNTISAPTEKYDNKAKPAIFDWSYIGVGECEHDWLYSDLASYPPIHTRKCRKCGKEEYIPRESKTIDGWIPGRGY